MSPMRLGLAALVLAASGMDKSTAVPLEAFESGAGHFGPPDEGLPSLPLSASTSCSAACRSEMELALAGERARHRRELERVRAEHREELTAALATRQSLHRPARSPMPSAAVTTTVDRRRVGAFPESTEALHNDQATSSNPFQQRTEDVRGGLSRRLLRASSCTVGEIAAIADSEDGTSAFLALMGTNADCGICLLGCQSASSWGSCIATSCTDQVPVPLGCSTRAVFEFFTAGSIKPGQLIRTDPSCGFCAIDCLTDPDSFLCIGLCLPEGLCTEVDSMELAGLVRVASLDDRAGIVAMLERTTASCASCILATIGHVCGNGCIEARMHISTERFPADRLHLHPCLPELAMRIIADQSEKLAATVAAAVPFSLVAAATSASPLANDLYVPTGKIQHGLAVYRGTDTGRYAFACDPALLGGRWALSSTDDETAWSRCDGELWLDIQSNRLSTANPTSADTEASDKDRQYSSAYAEPVVYRFNFEGCTAFLPAVVMSMPVATFAAGVPAEEVAC